MSVPESRGSASPAKSTGKSASGKGVSTKTAPGDPEPAPGKAWMAAVAAWLVPGLGHFLLGRRIRGLVFAVLVLTTVVIGCQLHGLLFEPVAQEPFSFLATFASMGMGLPYFVLRWGLGYEGVVTELGYEYGKAFLLTAGLMNCLLVLDAWDIACGRKQ